MIADYFRRALEWGLVITLLAYAFIPAVHQFINMAWTAFSHWA